MPDLFEELTLCPRKGPVHSYLFPPAALLFPCLLCSDLLPLPSLCCAKQVWLGIPSTGAREVKQSSARRWCLPRRPSLISCALGIWNFILSPGRMFCLCSDTASCLFTQIPPFLAGGECWILSSTILHWEQLWVVCMCSNQKVTQD